MASLLQSLATLWTPSDTHGSGSVSSKAHWSKNQNQGASAYGNYGSESNHSNPFEALLQRSVNQAKGDSQKYDGAPQSSAEGTTSQKRGDAEDGKGYVTTPSREEVAQAIQSSQDQDLEELEQLAQQEGMSADDLELLKDILAQFYTEISAGPGSEDTSQTQDLPTTSIEVLSELEAVQKEAPSLASLSNGTQQAVVQLVNILNGNTAAVESEPATVTVASPGPMALETQSVDTLAGQIAELIDEMATTSEPTSQGLTDGLVEVPATPGADKILPESNLAATDISKNLDIPPAGEAQQAVRQSNTALEGAITLTDVEVDGKAQELPSEIISAAKVSTQSGKIVSDAAVQASLNTEQTDPESPADLQETIEGLEADSDKKTAKLSETALQRGDSGKIAALAHGSDNTPSLQESASNPQDTDFKISNPEQGTEETVKFTLARGEGTEDGSNGSQGIEGSFQGQSTAGSSATAQSTLENSISSIQATSIQGQAPTSAAQSVSQPNAPTAAAQNILNQVGNETVDMIQRGQNEMLLRLNPENMGSVKIQLNRMAEGVLSARMVVDNLDTHQALKDQAQRLQQSLSEKGIQLEKVTFVLAGKGTIEVATDNKGQLYQQSNQSQQQEGTHQQQGQNHSQSEGSQHQASAQGNGSGNGSAQSHPTHSSHAVGQQGHPITEGEEDPSVALNPAGHTMPAAYQSNSGTHQPISILA